MKYVLILTSIFIMTAQAQGRKPALEEFVGVVPVEESEIKAIPQEPEARFLYKFSNQISNVKIEKTKQNKVSKINNSNNKSWSGALGFTLFLILPFLMWGAIVSFAPKKKAEVSDKTPDPEHPGDIKHLDDYRSTPDDSKKAS